MQRVELELSDKVYDQVRHRAVEAGFKTVSEYIADVVSDELVEPYENLDRYFTPDRIAHIDSVIAEVNSGGKTYTAAEVRDHFRKRFEE